MQKSLRFLPAFILLGTSIAAANPTLWNGWRGPGRDAEVPDFQTPAKWPSTLEQVWSVEVGGGYSTPLVENDRVYQQARLKGEEVLSCLDLSTGEVIWRGEPRAGENAALVAVPGHVFALTDHGKIHVLRSGAEKVDILYTYTVGDRDTWTAPALIGDSLLIKNGDTLARWKIPSGTGS